MLLSLCLLACSVQQQGGVPPSFADARRIFTDWRHSVFVVHAPKRWGTAFGVGDHDLFTCFHVVEGLSRITLEDADGKMFEGKVAGVDKEMDLAWITAEPIVQHAPLFCTYDLAKSIGSELVSIGSPAGVGQVVAKGVLGSTRVVQNQSHVELVLSLPVSRGSSGSPVFDGEGRIVGMVQLTTPNAQELNYALPASCLVDACAKFKIRADIL